MASERPVASSAASDQVRAPTSSQSVPDASDMSSIGFPRQLETKPCLGKQHRCGPGEDIRFVPANPKQLRSGETRHGAVAGNGAEVGERSLENAAFVGRPAVVPENARPQDLCAPVEQHGTMHLSGKPNPGDRRDLDRVTGRERVDRFKGRVPPILWVLFAPARPRALAP